MRSVALFSIRCVPSKRLGCLLTVVVSSLVLAVPSGSYVPVATTPGLRVISAVAALTNALSSSAPTILSQSSALLSVEIRERRKDARMKKYLPMSFSPIDRRSSGLSGASARRTVRAIRFFRRHPDPLPEAVAPEEADSAYGGSLAALRR